MTKSKTIHKPSEQEQITEAIRTLIRLAGDDPDRPELEKTPQRVADFYREFFSSNADTQQRYDSIANDVPYEDFILVRNIKLNSFCEHHMLPAYGHANIAYLPKDKLAGLGTIARIADDCARRLTTQEAITKNIISNINEAFSPAGIAVSVSLSHGCMLLRNASCSHSDAVTTIFTGAFKSDKHLKQLFIQQIGPKESISS